MIETELSVVIPVWNEEENIKKIIKITSDSLKDVKKEIVVVDDGSEDKTFFIAKKISKKYDFLKIIKHDVNRGYSDALKTGFNFCSGNYISFIDADLQNDPKDIPILLDFAKKGYGVVIGWRKGRNDTFKRLLISRLYNAFIHLLFLLPYPDINGKPKLFKSEVLKSINLETKQWFIDTELVHKAKKMGYKIIQVPVKHFARKKDQSKASIKKGIITIFDAMKYRFKSW